MQRAVERGLARGEESQPVNLGVDETSFQKRHQYVPVVTDADRGQVLYVADERTRGSLTGFHEQLNEGQLAAISSVAMDMWPGYIGATGAALPRA